MDSLEIIKKPRLRSPYLICVWPGMGDVAFKAAAYLVDKLGAEEFARIKPQDFFYQTGSTVKDGSISIPELPRGTFYFWKNKSGKQDLIIFISSAQPDLAKAEEYCRQITVLAKMCKVSRVVGFAAMPQPIDHAQDPGVWFAATSKELIETFKKLGFNPMSDGQVSGMNGLYLGIAKREGIDGFCLLGEIPLYTIQIENPKASASVLKAFSTVYGITIELDELYKQSQSVEDEINKLLDYLKLNTPSAGPIQEEEIEKIKKSLGQLTRLPVSVKERIERLFLEAQTDAGKANELKAQLDKWNVYKEYEDRFLDLFKKKKDENN